MGERALREKAHGQEKGFGLVFVSIGSGFGREVGTVEWKSLHWKPQVEERSGVPSDEGRNE